MRRRLFHLSLAFLLLIALAACNSETANSDVTNGDSDEEVSEPASDVEQEIIVATINDPVGLSPIETWDSASDLPIDQMYERLFERDVETGEIVPQLAESYENPDDLTWVFNLREGVEFHDGTPFNAEAVKYTFEKFIDPETAAPGAHLLSFVDKIEVVDEYTVSITTKEPNPNVLVVLTNRTLGIVSPTADQQQDLMKEPVGTGPFKFSNWVQGDRVELVRNENYWGDQPTLEKITFVTVPETSTAISMLETGEADVINGLEAQHLSRIESMQNAELLSRQGSSARYLSFNMNNELMQELPFRQAVAYALDIDSYIEQLDGVGFKSYSMFGPEVLDYDESIEGFGYEYDPDKAKEIIQEHGYDKETLTLLVSDRGVYKKMAEIVGAQLNEAGLNVKIETMDWGTFLDFTSKGEDFDLFVLGVTNTMNGLETLYGYLHSDSVGANNRTQYSNPEYDALVDEARQTMDDDARQELINKSHQHAIENAVIVPMHHEITSIAHNESVDGIDLWPEGIFNFKNAYRE